MRLAVRIDERVLTTRNLAVRVGKQVAILALRTKIKHVVTAGAAKLVRLRGENRRNRAVTILELHVNGGVVDAHSPLEGTRRTRFFQADNTRERSQRVGHIKATTDVTVGDTIRFNNLGRIRNRSSSNRARSLSLSFCCRLRGNNWVYKRRHQRHGESSGSNGSAATAHSSTLNFLLVHTKKSFP